jgi:hypothetical protein
MGAPPHHPFIDGFPFIYMFILTRHASRLGTYDGGVGHDHR